MRTIKIDILNEKVVHILRDLEQLDLIRLRREMPEENAHDSDWARYKGAITKQSLDEVDQQLSKLRNEWE